MPSLNLPFDTLAGNAGKSLFETAKANASVGMEIAAIAAMEPLRSAVKSENGNLSYAELNALTNQIAHHLINAGIGKGDTVALLCSNRPEFIAVRFACHRMGVILTPVNWHLTEDEASYVIDNCDAQALFADVRVSDSAIAATRSNDKLKVKIAIGGSIEGFEPWQTLDQESTENIPHPQLGNTMLYTSGTTGRPKGVFRDQPDPSKAADMQAILTAVFMFEPDSGKDTALTTGPLYHSGPFNLCMTVPLISGIGIVVMDKWEPELTLQLIQEHRITHTFFVPTMFVKLLKLDNSVREGYDVSSIRFIIHGAAPCAKDVKQAMLDWLGPVIWEMFAGTEGPGTIVSPQEWLNKPGTVGKPGPDQFRIIDEDGQQLSRGESGQIYIINPPSSTFSYYKDEEKTDRAQRDGYFTAGDIGYIDEDGYLFLTGRSAEVIIAGGVNIYPQEIDDVLIHHPAVADVGCVGVPNTQWGEEVKAVVQLQNITDASDALASELIEFASRALAKQKIPRSVDFVSQLPRSEAGKVQRKKLRDQYWQEQALIN